MTRGLGMVIGFAIALAIVGPLAYVIGRFRERDRARWPTTKRPRADISRAIAKMKRDRAAANPSIPELRVIRGGKR